MTSTKITTMATTPTLAALPPSSAITVLLVD
jgi:hypothetical protein